MLLQHTSPVRANAIRWNRMRFHLIAFRSSGLEFREGLYNSVNADAHPSFPTSQNTGTVVSPSPETVVRTAVNCFHCPPLMYGTT